LSGGLPGNKGGPGNISKRIRLKSAEILEGKAIGRLDGIVNDGTNMEAVAATNTLAKIALPTQTEVTMVADERVSMAWADSVAELLGPEAVAQLMPLVRARLGEE